MTEAEILEQTAIYIDRMFWLAQWYVAMSLALVTATHFAAKRLNLYILITIIGLYSAYTLLVFTSYVWNYNVMGGFFQELVKLGDTMSEGSKLTFSDPWGPYTNILFRWIGGAIFIATNAYLVGAYVQEKNACYITCS